MKWNKDSIINMDFDKIDTYIIYEMHGHGVMESPLEEGKTISIIKCSEFDAFITASNMNIQRYGYIQDRSSWESPIVTYKKYINDQS